MMVAAMLATASAALAFTAKLDVQADGRVMTGTLNCVPAGAIAGDVTLGLPTTNQTGPQLAAGGRAAGKYQLTVRVNGSFDARAPDSITGTADVSGTFTGADGAVGNLRGNGTVTGTGGEGLGFVRIELNCPQLACEGAGLTNPQPLTLRLPPFAVEKGATAPPPWSGNGGGGTPPPTTGNQGGGTTTAGGTTPPGPTGGTTTPPPPTGNQGGGTTTAGGTTPPGPTGGTTTPPPTTGNQGGGTATAGGTPPPGPTGGTTTTPPPTTGTPGTPGTMPGTMPPTVGGRPQVPEGTPSGQGGKLETPVLTAIVGSRRTADNRGVEPSDVMPAGSSTVYLYVRAVQTPPQAQLLVTLYHDAKTKRRTLVEAREKDEFVVTFYPTDTEAFPRGQWFVVLKAGEQTLGLIPFTVAP
ncbi:hypothetical protein LLH23_10380 [bacterium]|nr:hypothetical protein [bacterium]